MNIRKLRADFPTLMRIVAHLGQARFGALDAVLRLDRGHVQIGARFKCQRDGAHTQFGRRIM